LSSTLTWTVSVRGCALNRCAMALSRHSPRLRALAGSTSSSMHLRLQRLSTRVWRGALSWTVCVLASTQGVRVAPSSLHRRRTRVKRFSATSLEVLPRICQPSKCHCLSPSTCFHFFHLRLLRFLAFLVCDRLLSSSSSTHVCKELGPAAAGSGLPCCS